MPFRGSAQKTRRKSLLSAIVIVLLALRPPLAVAVGLFRIPLGSDDHLQFVGTAILGPSREAFRVVFDTGSSDTWVNRATPADFNANSRCLNDKSPQSPFHVRYGSGFVSGFAELTDLRVEGNDNVELLFPDICVGFADNKTPGVERLDVQGIVGLGMEALARINSSHILLTQLSRHQALTEPVTFSVYISSARGLYPPSQVILEGADAALTKATATWINLSILPSNALHEPSRLSSVSTKSFGYWALRLHGLALDGRVVPLDGAGRRDGVALVDSGTSFVLLPPHVFDLVSQELIHRFNTRAFARRTGLLSCRSCQVHEFPSLAFDFRTEGTHSSCATSQRFVLQGSDYVRCDRGRRECTAMLDSIQSSEVGADIPIVVLGSVFLRAYYTLFDYTHKQVALACTLDTSGFCSGGLNPALTYDGYEHGPRTPSQMLTSLWPVAIAFASLVGLQILLGISFKSLGVLVKSNTNDPQLSQR